MSKPIIASAEHPARENSEWMRESADARTAVIWRPSPPPFILYCISPSPFHPKQLCLFRISLSLSFPSSPTCHILSNHKYPPLKTFNFHLNFVSIFITLYEFMTPEVKRTRKSAFDSSSFGADFAPYSSLTFYFTYF